MHLIEYLLELDNFYDAFVCCISKLICSRSVTLAPTKGLRLYCWLIVI